MHSLQIIQKQLLKKSAKFPYHSFKLPLFWGHYLKFMNQKTHNSIDNTVKMPLCSGYCEEVR